MADTSYLLCRLRSVLCFVLQILNLGGNDHGTCPLLCSSSTVQPEEPNSSPTLSPSKPAVSTSEPLSQYYCCSWDFKSCGNDDYCNGHSAACETDCEGFWIDVTETDISTNCTARWEGCSDETSTKCCANMSCVLLSQQGSSYMACGLPEDAVAVSASLEPTRAPTTTPTAEPTPALRTTNSPSLTTTSPSPTIAPTMTTAAVMPTATPAPLGGGDVPDLPTGPFILTGYSERVVIPQPPPPILDYLDNLPRIDCPHRQPGLVDWTDVVEDSSLDVTLPENARVLLDAMTLSVGGFVTIPESSELILGEKGVDLSMGGMTVHGKLTAGSETCRIETSLILTLRGSRPQYAVQNPNDPHIKGISVAGGIISFHGKRYYRTWTRLSQTVEAGDRILMLQDAVNWEVGQEILLVTTAMKDSREWHQNEVLTIAYNYDDAPTGAALLVATPVEYRHVAIDNYQAEVGLLTRTIRIQGAAEDSEPTDLDPLTCQSDSYYFYSDNARPCGDTEITGYGAHVIVHQGGKGYIEGVEFYRVGQTNVLGRYPMHFHLLGDTCSDCYVKDSSFHRSYYRCISIHGTNSTLVSENVAYDIMGYCYYLEDGVEEGNTLSFNLAAFTHLIGPEPPTGKGQQTDIYTQSDTLTLPADVTASGFYITNVHNNIIGNTASGGYSGFAFPIFPKPTGLNANVNMRPSSATALIIDGNMAHSTGWWWKHAAGFYFGGALWVDNGVLTYNPGRSRGLEFSREPCAENFCETADCNGYCNSEDMLWNQITNTKTYLIAGVGLNSWSGRWDVVGFESHDNGLAIEALESGIWIDNMLAACRTGEPIAIPPAADITKVDGDGFFWYDTNQEHIMTDTIFRKCGVRSDRFSQYDTGTDRGCSASDDSSGCDSLSTVFGFLGHSDTHNPELMQASAGISFDNCGRRFYIYDYRGDEVPSTVSGRIQNWLDDDGSVSGLDVPTLIGSGLADAGMWWQIGEDVVLDEQGPLVFIPQNDGPERGFGHVHLEWDSSLHDQVRGSLCGNGDGQPCPAVGYIRHRGPRFASDPGLPVTANADITGPVGGYGWYLDLDNGPPKNMEFSLIEVAPETPLIFSVSYPPGTSFTIVAHAAWCRENSNFSCEELFSSVSSEQAVRESLGNTYHVSNDGLLTFRIIQTPQLFVGNPEFFLPSWTDVNRRGEGYALGRFERKGIRLPRMAYGPYLSVDADCAGSTYCTGASSTQVDAVCPSEYEQVAYDKCCNGSECVYASGQLEQT